MPSVSMLPSGRFRGSARVGKQRDTLTFDRRADARSWAEKTEERMRKGTWSRAEPEQAPAEPERTFKQAAEAYLASAQFLVKKPNTRHGELHKLKPAIAALGAKAFSAITSTDIENYLAARALVKPLRVQRKIAAAEQANQQPAPELTAATLSKDQRRLELAAISAVYNYGKKQKWLDTNPTRDVQRPGSSRRTRRVDDDVIGKVLMFMIELEQLENDERPYLFFCLLFSCLARPGELAKARKSWLRDDIPQIALPSDEAKNHDARSILMTEGFHRTLKEYLATTPDECPYVFGTLGRDGVTWRPYNYAVPWKKAREALGLTGLVAHMARHEGISRLFERTELSDGQIGALAGHRTPQALWRYKHLRNELQRPTIDMLHKDVLHAVDRAITNLHPSRSLRPGERLGDNQAVPTK